MPRYEELKDHTNAMDQAEKAEKTARANLENAEKQQSELKNELNQ